MTGKWSKYTNRQDSISLKDKARWSALTFIVDNNKLAKIARYRLRMWPNAYLC